MASTQPFGTVTFLFSDIEGSTKLWEQQPAAMRPALAQHDAILRSAVESNHGQIIKTTGDGVHAVFSNPLDAANATLSAQQQFQAPLGELQLKIRMGIHSGEAEQRGGDYYGPALNRAARLMAASHGGQILISNATAELLRDQLPVGVTLRDLGEHRLKDLTRPEQIFQLSHPTLPDEFPPIKTIDSFPNNLPIQLTSFVGRDIEIGEIKALLKAARLVTLTGSGGTGKTRLTLEVGTQELGSYANGVWLIELAALVDPAQVLPAFAQAFGLQELPFMPLATLVTDYLRDKQLLLLLDNCEHLIEACARIADDLLHQCGRLKILASSREALGIAGEVAYRIPSLAEAEATCLFLERAQAANPRFRLTDGNAPAVAKICARLDGIPLAIELAAARTKLLSPDQIAVRLDDRFRLLVGGSRTALPRQQTLRALIDWSYDLLPEEEKQLLRTASVFFGGWTLDALEAVSDDSKALEHLEQLVNKSLVVTEERESEMRYFMLETIRQYAREKLLDSGQAAVIRDRHFLYFDDLAERVWNVFLPATILVWRDKADDEEENLRAAVEWVLENHIEESIRLSANFCFISGWIGNKQMGALALGKRAIEGFKSLPPVDGPDKKQREKNLAKALFAQGVVGMGSGNIPVVLQDLQEAIACARSAGDKRMLGYSLEMYFTAATFINAPGAAEAAEEGFRIFRDEVQDNWGLTMAYQNMANIAFRKGDQVVEDEYFRKQKELMKDAPLSIQAGLFYLALGMNEKVQGNFETAKSYFEDGLKVFKRIRNRIFQTTMTSELGHLARQTGKFMEAKKIYHEVIRDWQDIGNRAAIANQLECIAFIAIIEEEPQRAIKLLGAAEALRDKIQSPMTDSEQIEYDQFIAQLHPKLAETDYNSLWAEGRTMPVEQAVLLALN